MTDSRAALGSDRLPWLTDEPAPAPAKPKLHKKPALSNLWGPAAALMLLLAVTSYWLGTRSVNDDQPKGADSSRSVVTPLPQPTTPPQKQVEIAPQPEVNPAPAREVRSEPQRQLRIERPRPIRRIIVQNPEAPPEEATDESPTAASPPASAPKPTAPATERPLRAWPASESAGAKGRIVRVGAFGTRQQAKLGWRYMVRSYPAVSHLKATVVTDRNSRGRRFYRFQIGTTSQAHSEVLCQRMERIRFSCAVVGLPWRPKGVER
jgi:hypothetical protein